MGRSQELKLLQSLWWWWCNDVIFLSCSRLQLRKFRIFLALPFQGYFCAALRTYPGTSPGVFCHLIFLLPTQISSCGVSASLKSLSCFWFTWQGQNSELPCYCWVKCRVPGPAKADFYFIEGVRKTLNSVPWRALRDHTLHV